MPAEFIVPQASARYTARDATMVIMGSNGNIGSGAITPSSVTYCASGA